MTSLGLGGAETLVLSYLKNLDPRKYSLFVCYLREKPDDLSEEMSGYATMINLKIKNKFNPLTIFQLLKVLREIQPDITHTHLFQPRIYTTLANLFYRKTVLITHKHSIVNIKKHHLFILLEMVINFANKKIIAISESVKNSLSKFEFIPHNKIFVLHNCIDYQKFNKEAVKKNNFDGNDIVIGIVGRIEKVKGIEYLILAMKIILAKFPNVKLEIIGDGSELSNLKSLAESSGISKSVFFFGKFKDVIPFYKRMDIFVLPSVLEGFGIVLLEAMASGIPVVATNVNGIKEVVADMKNGLLIPSRNPEAIAQAVIKLIENPELTYNLVNNGLERARNFDIQSHINKLENLYTNLLGAES